jgi:hypothetical protein
LVSSLYIVTGSEFTSSSTETRFLNLKRSSNPHLMPISGSQVLSILDSIQQNLQLHFFILIPGILEYVEINQQNALYSRLLYFFFFRWLLHVSAKRCHPQVATKFLSEALQRQYDRRQVIERMPEPAYRCTIQRTGKVHYQVHTDTLGSVPSQFAV